MLTVHNAFTSNSKLYTWKNDSHQQDANTPSCFTTVLYGNTVLQEDKERDKELWSVLKKKNNYHFYFIVLLFTTESLLLLCSLIMNHNLCFILNMFEHPPCSIIWSFCLGQQTPMKWPKSMNASYKYCVHHSRVYLIHLLEHHCCL